MTIKKFSSPKSKKNTVIDNTFVKPIPENFNFNKKKCFYVAEF